MKIYRGRKLTSIKSKETEDRKMGKKSGEKKLNGTVIVTYRCNARCNMCNRYKNHRNRKKKFQLRQLRNFLKCILQILRVESHLSVLI